MLVDAPVTSMRLLLVRIAPCQIQRPPPPNQTRIIAAKVPAQPLLPQRQTCHLNTWICLHQEQSNQNLRSFLLDAEMLVQLMGALWRLEQGAAEVHYCITQIIFLWPTVLAISLVNHLLKAFAHIGSSLLSSSFHCLAMFVLINTCWHSNRPVCLLIFVSSSVYFWVSLSKVPVTLGSCRVDPHLFISEGAPVKSVRKNDVSHT